MPARAMTGQAGSTPLIHSHYRYYIVSGLLMCSLEGVAPRRPRDFGDHESGGILSGRFPPQGISFVFQYHIMNPLSCRLRAGVIPHSVHLT